MRTLAAVLTTLLILAVVPLALVASLILAIGVTIATSVDEMIKALKDTWLL